MGIFSPASPDTQTAPILKQQEDNLNSQIPSVLNYVKPKDSPTELFQNYLDTGNSVFKQAAGKALNNLSVFANKAQTFASQFPDNLIGNVQTVDNSNRQPVPIDPNTIHQVSFSENAVPIAHLSNGQMTPIDKLDVGTSSQPLSSLSYTAITGKKDGEDIKETTPVTDSTALQTAGLVKHIADSVAPQYTGYLLKLANNEGTLNPDARNYNFKDGTSSTSPSDADQHGGIDSVDRGLFQINNKAFPQITDQMADNPAIATLWAISLIDAGKQSKWAANNKTRDMSVSYQ